jgi:SAM-dependent methyltransferase
VALGASGMAGAERKIVVNLGCGPKRQGGLGGLPPAFADWRELRVDVDPLTQPDILTDITDLSAIRTGTVDAVWASHCIEHLYQHQVGKAFAEINRVLAPVGIACILVPDLQTIAGYIVADRMHEPVYDSPAGPITPHDVVFGYGADIAKGRTSMAHRCGFTPAAMVHALAAANFGQSVVLRRSTLELAAVASKAAWSTDAERDAIVRQLGL